MGNQKNQSCSSYYFFSYLMSFFIKFNNLLGEKIRISISSIIFSLVCLVWITDPFFGIPFINYFSILAILLVAALSVSQFNPEIKANRLSLTLICLLGFSYIISALYFNYPGRIIIGLSYGLLVPIVSLMLTSKDNRIFFIKAITLGNTIAFIVLIIISAIYAPLVDKAYSSIMLNPNGLAFALLPMAISLIYVKEVLIDGNKKLLSYIFIGLIGCNLALILFSRSRTGLLSFLVILIFWFLHLKNKYKRWPQFLLKIICLTLIFVLMFFLMNILLTVVNQEILIFRRNTFEESTIFFTVDYVVQKNDLNPIQKQDFTVAEFQETLDLIVTKSGKGITNNEDISSGRFIIWEKFIKSINFIGHDKYEKVHVPERSIRTKDPHNIFLTVGYEIGIIPMLILILFLLNTIFQNTKYFIKILKNKSFSTSSFYYFSISSSFGIVALLSSIYIPYRTMISIAFWTSIVLFKEKNELFK